MPDPVRPVAPRIDLVDLKRRLARWNVTTYDTERCVEEIERLLALLNEPLAVSPVPWAGSGSGEKEELTRGETRDYAEVSSPPQPPIGDK